MSKSFSVSQSVETKSVTYKLQNVMTAAQTSSHIKQGKAALSRANNHFQYACIGAAYQVLAHGNTTQVKELLGALGLTSQRYQKIFAAVSVLTGELRDDNGIVTRQGLISISEEGTGKKREIKVTYKFDQSIKDELLGDMNDPKWNPLTTSFYALSQKPWWDYQLANENYGFDQDKWGTSLKKMIVKGIVDGNLAADVIQQVYADAIAEGEAERKKKLAEQQEKQAAEIRAQDETFTNTISDAVSQAVEAQEFMIANNINLIKKDFISGSINKEVASARLADELAALNPAQPAVVVNMQGEAIEPAGTDESVAA